jgi:hypothetical protein
VVGVFRGCIFYQRRPAGPDFLTAKDTKYTKRVDGKTSAAVSCFGFTDDLRTNPALVFQRRGKRKSPRLGGEGLGEDGQKTIFDVGFNARPHLYPLPLERSSPLHDSGFTDDLPNNPALDFYKDAGNEKALASEERVWVRTVV